MPSWIGSKKLFGFQRCTCTPASGCASQAAASSTCTRRLPGANWKPAGPKLPASESPGATIAALVPLSVTVARAAAPTVTPVSPSSAAFSTTVAGAPPSSATVTVPPVSGAPRWSSTRSRRAPGSAARSVTNVAQLASHTPLAAMASAQLSGSRHSRSWNAKARNAVLPGPAGALANGAPAIRQSSAAGVAPALPRTSTICTGSPPGIALKPVGFICGKGESWNAVQAAPGSPGMPLAVPLARATAPVAKAATAVPAGSPIHISGSCAKRSAGSLGTGAEGVTRVSTAPCGTGVAKTLTRRSPC